MAYVPDPTDTTEPLDSRPAGSASAEFRALKAYIAGLAGLPGLFNYAADNRIIGGDFGINPWGRGTNFAAIAAGAYSADRFRYDKVGAVVHTVSKAANAPTIDQAGVKTDSCVQLAVTTQDAAIAAGDFCIYEQRIEGINAVALQKQNFILQFWHAHTKTGKYCVAFQNSAGTHVYVEEYTQTVADAWEKSTISVPANAGDANWLYTTAVIGMKVIWCFSAGINFQTPRGVWNVAAAGQFATANQVNASDVVGNNCRLALIDLRVGSVTLPYNPRSVTEEDILCRRYYEKSFKPGVTPANNIGGGTGELRWINNTAGASGNNGAAGQIIFKVQKMIAPTITLRNPSANNAQIRDISAAADYTVSGVTSNVTENQASLAGTSPAGSVVGGLSGVHWEAAAEL